MTRNRLAWTLLAVTFGYMTFTPMPGASWVNAAVAICGVFAATVILVGDIGEDEWSPTRDALDELRKVER
jgi:hypothetical protein